MSKSSGGTRQGGLSGDSGYRGKIENIETLKNISHRNTYKAVGEAISRFNSVISPNHEQNVKLATMSGGVMGVQVNQGGKSVAVYLNKSYFKNATTSELVKDMNGMYDRQWQTRTNKPVAHVVTHELAHSVWNSSLDSQNAKAATAEIRKLRKEWIADKSKTGYGKYSRTNIDEFWAEVTTKAVHGKADRYTQRVKDIVRKYKL